MTPRDVARYMAGVADEAARDTRAFRRGTVDQMRESDARPVVRLPNGARVLGGRSDLAPSSIGQPVSMLAGYAVFAPSAFGGGLGAPFQPPEP